MEWWGGGRVGGVGAEWRKASWKPVEVIQVKHDYGLSEGCEGWMEWGMGGTGQSFNTWYWHKWLIIGEKII